MAVATRSYPSPNFNEQWRLKIKLTLKNGLPNNPGGEFLWLALSVLAMLCFVNGFPVWVYLYQKLTLQSLVVMPIAVVFILIFGLMAWFARKGLRLNIAWFGLAIFLAVIGLYLPDAAVPSKRIHVAEYMLLAIVMRKALSYRHAGVALVIWTVLLTTLLGVHDEILQGLHVQRYYGLRDMLVNAFGAMSGAVLGHALFLFERDSNESNYASVRTLSPQERIGILSVTVGIVIWVILLKNYTGLAMPPWTILPLLLMVFCWFMFSKLIHNNKN